MSLSEKIKNIKFSKGAIGYNVKDVDAFMDECAILSSDCESQVHTLRAKLDAFQCRADEIAKREEEAAAVLEAAKNEALSIIDAAKVEAAKEIASGKFEAEKIIGGAKAEATEISIKAKVDARILLEKANEKADEINAKAAALVKACDDFEAKFRTEVAKTVKNLADIKKSAPKVKVIAPIKEEPAVEAPAEKVEDPVEMQDFAFVGGKRLDTTVNTDRKNGRKVFDTLSVTYDNAFESDFEEIKRMKEDISKKGIKNPVEFSE